MLGHLNYKKLTKIVNVVRGIPKLGKKQLGVCGPYQLGKQLKSTHKVLQQITTIRVLELLYINLIGLMQVESTNGNRYFLYVLTIFLDLLR